MVEQLRGISAVKYRRVPIFDEDISDKVTTIDELWKKLTCHWTIYDYDILVLVVDLTECKQAQEVLDNFVAKIDPSALEDVDLVLCCKVYGEELFKPLLRVKVNAEHCTLVVKNEVKEIISKRYDLEKYSLRFKGIREGCIELIYNMSKAVTLYLLQFTVTGSVTADFAAHKIISLWINDIMLLTVQVSSAFCIWVKCTN